MIHLQPHLLFPRLFLHSYLHWHVGQSSVFFVMADGDIVGGLLVGLIEAGKRLASIGWLVVSRCDLPVEAKKRGCRRF